MDAKSGVGGQKEPEGNDRQTDTQTDRHTDRHTDRQTDRQTDTTCPLDDDYSTLQ